MNSIPKIPKKRAKFWFWFFGGHTSRAPIPRFCACFYLHQAKRWARKRQQNANGYAIKIKMDDDWSCTLSISPLMFCPIAGSIGPIFERSALKKANDSAPTLRRYFLFIQTPSICPIFFPRPRPPLPFAPFTPPTAPIPFFDTPCNTQGASSTAGVTLAVASRHTHMPVSIISSRHSHSRSSSNTRASSHTDQPLTRGISHSRNRPPIPFPPSSNPQHPNSQFTARHVRRLHTRV